MTNLNETTGVGAIGTGGGESAPYVPPATLTEALRRNRFMRDENGQAMVEMVVVAPFLLFGILTIMYFWGTLDMQADYYIRASEGYWQVAAKGDSAGRTMGTSDAPFGLGDATSAFGLNLGGAIGNLLTIRNGQSIGNPIITYPIANANNVLNWGFALAGTQKSSPGVFSLPTGGPDRAMGLENQNYDETDPENYMYTNPWRNTLLGIASFFSSPAGDEQVENVDTLFPEELPIRAKYRMITDPWRANNKDEIRDRCQEVTFFTNPWGFGTHAFFNVTHAIIDLPYVTPATLYEILPAAFNRAWYHNPFYYKIDNNLYDCYRPMMFGFPTGSPLNRCVTRTGQQAIDQWR